MRQIRRWEGTKAPSGQGGGTERAENAASVPRGRPGAVARRRLPGILALSVLICTRRGTLRKGSARQIPGMHRDGFTKHPRITKYGAPQSPAFPVGVLKGLFSIYIYLYIFLNI